MSRVLRHSVGTQSDALVSDDALDAARAAQQAVRAAIKPRALSGRRYEVGDGDPCPLDPAHGRMCFLSGTGQQCCPHQTHDGKTRALWPQGTFALEAAVKAYRPVPAEAFSGESAVVIDGAYGTPPITGLVGSKNVTPKQRRVAPKFKQVEPTVDTAPIVDIDISAMEV